MNFLLPRELASKSKEWVQQLGVPGEEPVALRSTALLVLDMQKDFLEPWGQLPVWGGPAAVPQILQMLSAFRRAEAFVVFSRHVCLEPRKHQGRIAIMERVKELPELLREGTKGVEFHDDIRPFTGEPVITKYRYSAFYDTPLDTILRVNGISTVIVTGVASNICCEATAHDAFFRGYEVYFALDATGGTDEAAHLATLRNIQLSYGKLVTTAQLI